MASISAPPLAAKHKEDAMVHLQKLSITKRALDGIPTEERRLVISLAHAANELNAFSRLFHFAANQSGTGDFVTQAENAQALAIARVLTGKLLETWNLLQKQFISSPVSKAYLAKFSDADKALLQEVKRYFSHGNVIARVRNRFAFHYDANELDQGYASLQPDDNLDIYLAKHNVNSFFAFGETVTGRAMLECIVPTDPQAAFKLLIEETSNAGAQLTDVIAAIIAASFEMHCGGMRSLERKPVQLDNTPDAQSISIPYFVTIESTATD